MTMSVAQRIKLIFTLQRIQRDVREGRTGLALSKLDELVSDLKNGTKKATAATVASE